MTGVQTCALPIFGEVDLSWSESTTAADGNALTDLSRYVVFRSEGSASSFVQVGQVTATQFSDTGLDESTTYFYQVVATDELGNESSRSSSVQVTTQGPDRVGPSAPQNLSAVASQTDFGQVDLSWSASTTDADGNALTDLSRYVVFRPEGSASSFVQVGQVTATQVSDTGLDESTTYCYQVVSLDESGNEIGRASCRERV